MARAVFFLFYLVPAAAFAASPGSADFFRSGLRLFVGMFIVVGIMLLFHVLNRKGFKLLESRHGGRIRILETRPVGGRKSLCLVEIEGERLLLGLGGDRVDLLHHFDSGRAGGGFENKLRQAVEAEP